MRNWKLMLIAVVGMPIWMFFSSVAHADPVVTVTDQKAVEPGIYRYNQFIAEFTATVQGAPVTNDEAFVVGSPKWTWESSKYTMHYIPDSPSATLMSDWVNHLVTLLDPGSQTVLVTATVTYPRTDPFGKALPSIVCSGTCQVHFFVVAPLNVTQVGFYVNIFNGGGVSGQDGWGHGSIYQLEINDNQPLSPQNPNGSKYPFGLPREEFSNILRYVNLLGWVLVGDVDPVADPYSIEAPNGTRGPATWGINTVNGTGTPMADFDDGIGYRSPANPQYPNGNDPLVWTFDQPWHCMELTPPYDGPQGHLYCDPAVLQTRISQYPHPGDFLPNVLDTPLNTHHIANYYRHTNRTYTLNK